MSSKFRSRIEYLARSILGIEVVEHYLKHSLSVAITTYLYIFFHNAVIPADRLFKFSPMHEQNKTTALARKAA